MPPTPVEPGKGKYTTISIPQPLYLDIKKAIEGTGFRSPTEFLVYVARTSLQKAPIGQDVRPRGPPFVPGPSHGFSGAAPGFGSPR